ncbi:hypothetical protein BLA24_27170 [Streptomyces cinnamoneus]|uniref:Serine/arginine repetitive matrix protein 2 n=1 Tax=Streptomyces cinnamoneus TaxID=53446 RepID=A0A2G1XC10_STRCJ|nr:hypothetical protein [Streptomyces cinnamoneus]PHQ48762.1 hypothetical protein BLA24_27170 [Streptomyces cinnamoneus]PPT14590.1 hypothetical protein CYQ11_18485 [Streptomyces cinnamoneus]
MSYWDADLQRWVDSPDHDDRTDHDDRDDHRTSGPYPPGPGATLHVAPDITPIPHPSFPDDPPAGPSHARILAGVLVGAVLAGGLGTGIWALVRDDGDGDGTTGHDDVLPGVSASVTPGPTDLYGASAGTAGGGGGGFTPGPGPAPTTAPTTAGTFGDPAVPAGFRRVTDPAGYRLAVPLGWQRRTERESVFYESSDGRSLIQVFVLNPPRATPYDSLAESETYVSQYRGYQKSRLTHAAGPGDPAELEYTYVQADSTRRHSLIHAYTAPDGRQYALLVAGPESGWTAMLQVQRALVSTFCPLGYCTTS